MTKKEAEIEQQEIDRKLTRLYDEIDKLDSRHSELQKIIDSLSKPV